MIKVKFNRRSLCAGDDVHNGVYVISLPDDAVLGDLMKAVLFGGCGNDWSTPSNSVGWDIYTNTGMIANVSPDKDSVTYLLHDGSTPLADTGIEWVFAEYAGDVPHMLSLRYRFAD